MQTTTTKSNDSIEGLRARRAAIDTEIASEESRLRDEATAAERARLAELRADIATKGEAVVAAKRALIDALCAVVPQIANLRAAFKDVERAKRAALFVARELEMSPAEQREFEGTVTGQSEVGAALGRHIRAAEADLSAADWAEWTSPLFNR